MRLLLVLAVVLLLQLFINNSYAFWGQLIGGITRVAASSVDDVVRVAAVAGIDDVVRATAGAAAAGGGDAAVIIVKTTATGVARAAATGLDDVARAAATGLDDAARAAATGLDDAARAAGAGLDDVARAVATGLDDVGGAVGKNLDELGKSVASLDDYGRTVLWDNNIVLLAGKAEFGPGISIARVASVGRGGESVKDFLISLAKNSPAKDLPQELLPLLNEVRTIALDRTLAKVIGEGMTRLGGKKALDPTFWKDVTNHLVSVKNLRLTDEILEAGFRGMKELEPSQLLNIQRYADDMLKKIAQAGVEVNRIGKAGSVADFHVRRSAGEVVRGVQQQVREKMAALKIYRAKGLDPDKLGLVDTKLFKGADEAKKGLDEAQKGLEEATKNVDEAMKGVDEAKTELKRVTRTVLEDATVPITDINQPIANYITRANELITSVGVQVAQSSNVARAVGAFAVDNVVVSKMKNAAIGVGAGAGGAGVAGGIAAAVSGGGTPVAVGETAILIPAVASATATATTTDINSPSQTRNETTTLVNRGYPTDYHLTHDKNHEFGFLTDLLVNDYLVNLVEDDDLDGDYNGFERTWDEEDLKEDQRLWELRLAEVEVCRNVAEINFIFLKNMFYFK